MKTQTVLSEFTARTSLHGIVDLSESSGLFKKAIWTLVLLVSSTVAFYQVGIGCQQLSLAQPKTRLHVADDQRLDFPIVTICHSYQAAGAVDPWFYTYLMPPAFPEMVKVSLM